MKYVPTTAFDFTWHDVNVRLQHYQNIPVVDFGGRSAEITTRVLLLTAFTAHDESTKRVEHLVRARDTGMKTELVNQRGAHA